MTQEAAPIAQASRPLKFGYFYAPAGSHPAGWRHPGGRHDAFDPDEITEVAQRAEAGGFAFIHFGERLTSEIAGGQGHPDALARTEPFTTASFVATRTRKIGILATANTSYFEPFNLARLTASLDHVTHGRAGWHIVTGATRPAGRNFSEADLEPKAHYERATEVVDILRKLWDSWEDDAFIRNKETGEYVDGTKIHPIDHVGDRFRIKGPLNVARPPQGQLILAHDVWSELSADLAAREANLAFITGKDTAEVQQLVDQVRGKAASYGRAPGSITIFSTVTPIVAETLAEARQIYDDLNALIVLDPDFRLGGATISQWLVDTGAERNTGRPGARNLGALSRRLGVDVSQKALDDVVEPALSARFGGGGRDLLDTVQARTGRAVGTSTPPTIADLLFAHIVDGNYLLGGPSEIADEIDAFAKAAGVDGLIIRSAYLPDQLRYFVDWAVPELKRRGLLAADYQGATLRDHLGLAAPRNRYETA